MLDLALLIPRTTGSFARDARFAAAEAPPPPFANEAAPAPLPANPPDPVAQAHALGFAEGMAAARDDARAQAEDARRHHQALVLRFSRLDAELAETLRQRLMTTVAALCETALAPLALDLRALTARITRAAAMFSRADDERVIRLHPDDLALAQPLLPDDWVLKPDPGLARGALRVETESGGAEDGPEQWRQAILAALDAC